MPFDRKAYQKNYQKKYRQSKKFKSANKVYQKNYKQSEKFKAANKIYRSSEKFIEINKAYQRKYRLSKKGKASQDRFWQTDIGKAYRKEYSKAHRKKHTLYNRKYRRTEKAKFTRRKRAKYRFTNDPIFKLNNLIRTRMQKYIKMKSLKKSKRTFEIVGCTPQELRTFIESKFQPGMTWKNHGEYGWHVDHVIALSSAKTEDELMKLFHYTNLQPLWAKDNILKSNKVIPQNGIR